MNERDYRAEGILMASDVVTQLQMLIERYGDQPIVLVIETTAFLQSIDVDLERKTAFYFCAHEAEEETDDPKPA